MDISPDFSTLGLVLAVPLVGYVLTEWLLGKVSYDRMLRCRDGDPRALVRMLRLWGAGAWACTAMVFAILAVSPGVDPSDLGLVLPDETGTTAGILVAVVMLLPVMAFLRQRLIRAGGTVSNAIEAMYPRTSTERWWMLAMAVTAGICEEVVYRGFLIALGVGVLGLNVNVAAGLALVVFAVGHLYQGWRGVLLVTVLGYSLTRLYLSTGSLLASIGMHIAIDVFALVVTPMTTRRTAPTGS